MLPTTVTFRSQSSSERTRGLRPRSCLTVFHRPPMNRRFASRCHLGGSIINRAPQSAQLVAVLSPSSTVKRPIDLRSKLHAGAVFSHCTVTGPPGDRTFFRERNL